MSTYTLYNLVPNYAEGWSTSTSKWENKQKKKTKVFYKKVVDEKITRPNQLFHLKF